MTTNNPTHPEQDASGTHDRVHASGTHDRVHASGTHDRVHAIDACPRCGTQHGNQRFQRLVRPIRIDDSNFTHWWPCTTTGEPVLAEFPTPTEAPA